MKKLSPVVLRTVKRAKKGISTTVKLCKKTAKTAGDSEESLFLAWFWIIRLVASIALKAGKQTIRKGRLPKFNFIKKHFTRAATYYTLFPALLVIFVYIFREVSPTFIPWLRDVLIIYWVASNVYKEAVLGKQKKKKKKIDKPKEKKEKKAEVNSNDSKPEIEMKFETLK